MEERAYYLGFSVFPGIGPKRFSELLSVFGSAKAAWNADEEQLRRILGNAYGSAFTVFRKTFLIDAYLERLRKSDVGFVTFADSEYPKLLKDVPAAPFILYYRGDVRIFQEKLYIGVVGTRKITGYGRYVTELITRELVAGRCVIVSGLALGVDAVAHRVTLEEEGKTIAVLGSGVDVCHPASNRKIYEEIISSGGAVVSEYPLGEPPSKGSFPSRNRIIAGLSEGVVVTEGAVDSGALITADDAFLLQRRVYAVPGPITSTLSKGPNVLLSKGAKVVTSGRDILEDLGIRESKNLRKIRIIKGETEEEQMIIDLLQDEALLFDEIVKRTGFDSSKIGILLSFMEMKGMIMIMEAGKYSLST